MTPHASSTTRHALLILIGAIVIVAVGFGVRQSLGLFMRPVSEDLGWGREVLSLSIALQAFVIGFGAPFAGAAADKFGAGRVLMVGGLCFAVGLFGMSISREPWMMLLFAGPVAGASLAAIGMPVILGLIGKVAPEEKRSLWLGIATGCSTLGQLVLIPLVQGVIDVSDWSTALVYLALLGAIILPVAWGISRITRNPIAYPQRQSLGEALTEARQHSGYVLLTIGFFVCGFHVAFLAAHLPAHITDQGLKPALGATALIVVALFNMLGSWIAGLLGGRYSKKHLLVFIYLGRAVTFTLFVLLPTTPFTVYLFAAVMGLLWLSTVPLTTGIIAQVFGTRYMSTLYAITFLSHQIGSFLGVWLGGRLYDVTGSYAPVWWAGVALGVLAALLHAPIDEKPLFRMRASAT